MNFKHLLVALAFVPPFSHGAESDYFAIDTRGDSFAIADFDSAACHGAYRSIGGRTAYLLPGVGHLTLYRNLTFTAHSKSVDVVKYEYFVNGVSQGAPSASKTFDFPLVGRSVGDRLSVIGYDVNGTPTKEFRANLDVVKAPQWMPETSSQIDVSDRAVRYNFGVTSLSARKTSIMKFSCPNKKGRFFPTFGGTKTVDSEIGGYGDLEAEFVSDGSVTWYWHVGPFRKKETFRTGARNKKGRFVKWGKALGTEIRAGGKLDWCRQWQPKSSTYDFSYAKGGMFAAFAVDTCDFRPAFFPVAYFNATLGLEGCFEAEYRAASLASNLGDVWSSLEWQGVLTPEVTLRGGVGKKNLKVEARGTGKMPCKVNIDDFPVRVMASADLSAGVEAHLFWFDYNKEFKFMQGGPWQLYPTAKATTASVGDGVPFTARPFPGVRKRPHVYSSPLRAKAVSGDEFVLASDVPLVPFSQLVADNGGLSWVQVVDDPNRNPADVSSVRFYTQSSNDVVFSEGIWDSGTNAFEPHLLKQPNGVLTMICTSANCSWQGIEDYATAFKSLRVVCADRFVGGQGWTVSVVTPQLGYYHDISASADENGDLLLCWVANDAGSPFATAEAPDKIMSARRVNGVWQSPVVVVDNAGGVESGSLDRQNGEWIYVYSVEDLSEAAERPCHKLMCARATNGGWKVEELVADENDNCTPRLSHDEAGRSVLAWVRNGELAVSYDLGKTASSVFASGGQALLPPEFVTDTEGNLCGIQLVASPTNIVTQSRELLFSRYDPEFEQSRWSVFAPLTDNVITERNPRGICDASNGIVRLVYHEDPHDGEVVTNRYGILRERVYSIGTDLALAQDVEFEDNLELGSNTTVWVSVENRGLTTCAPTNGVVVKMYRLDTAIASAAIEQFPTPGASVKVGLPWRVTMSPSASNLTFRLDEAGVLPDINRSNNEVSLAMPEASLRIDSFSVRNGPGSERILSACVVNDGLQYSANGEVVTFRKDAEDGKVLGCAELPAVSVGETQQCAATVTIDVSTLNLTSEYTKVYAVMSNSVKSALLVVRKDTDGDGLSDDEEDALGCDKTLVDTDGDGFSDFEEVRIYGSSPTGLSYRVTFDLGGHGLNRDGANTQNNVFDGGLMPRFPEVHAKAGFRFVGWEEEVVPVTGETAYHAKYEEIVCWVDAVNGSDANAGTNAATAFRTLQYAVGHRGAAMKVKALDGVYEPFTCENKSIVIESVNGSRNTIIDGGGTNRCATLGTNGGQTNTVLRGFTLRNGNANGNAVTVSRKYGGGVCFGTLEDCHIYGNTAYTYQYSDSFGGGAYAANLRNCIIGGNWGYYGGGVHLPRLASGAFVVEECVFTRNRGSTGSAIFVGNGTGESPSVCKCLIDGNWATSWIAVYDAKRDNSFLLNKCTVIGNSSLPYNSAGVGYASAIDSIIWDNRTRVDVVGNHTSAIMTNCCTTPLPSGAGNISDNPQFVDAEHRVYQLMPDSPCIGAASNGSDMGASVVAPTSGFVIGTDTDGCGLILEPGTVVEDGGNVAFTAAEIGREFLHFKTNGVFATSDRVLELSNIHSDILVTAVFARREFFVDAANGNDGNDGLSWATARRSITSAINDTMDYDIITVMNGVYSPITPGTKKIKIQSVNGAAETVIDGGLNEFASTAMRMG